MYMMLFCRPSRGLKLFYTLLLSRLRHSVALDELATQGLLRLLNDVNSWLHSSCEDLKRDLSLESAQRPTSAGQSSLFESCHY